MRVERQTPGTTIRHGINLPVTISIEFGTLMFIQQDGAGETDVVAIDRRHIRGFLTVLVDLIEEMRDGQT